MQIHRAGITAALAVGLLATALPARAWIYPEHRSIAGTAVSELAPADREALDALWAEARKGHEERLCDTPWAGDQGKNPACLDWSAWPAISGDHSCSAGQMLGTVLESDWVLKVAGICSRLEVSLATAKNPIQLTNRLVKSDLELERADKEYSSRAGANNVHFLLSRMSDDPLVYLKESVKTGGDLNAVGVWIRAHLAAMRLARELASGRVAPGDRPALARRALALEAYGLHFLEDSFAAGHVAGTWGNVATRKGTHDYYNEHGLDTRTWGGDSIILYGDARMRPQDRERAAKSVGMSLSQLLAALRPDDALAVAVEEIPLPSAEGIVSFDTCTSMTLPGMPPAPEALYEPLGSILRTFPVPGRETEGALPRFRSEVGPFIGIASSLRGAFASGGLDAETASTRWTGTMDLSARFGLGLDALLGEMGDGQIFLQVGVSYSTKQVSTCNGCTGEEAFYGLFPRMPARTGLSTRIRLPFWLIPGDLLVATPLLVFTSPHTLEKMGITAANGGLIPWQAAFSTFLGRMQFCLGREVGATFYGYSGGEDKLLVVEEAPAGSILVPIALRSVDVELPVLEVRPFRDFSAHQTSALVFQLGAGADIPTKVTVLSPSTAPKPDLSPSWYGYVKLVFDWRRYF
ncbi:MAG: hypothetical protein U0529_04320 [Thermoanaerobaculia bacterium]